MLYSAEIMEKICINILPFGKDVNLLISSFIITSDSISSILIKKINKTKNLLNELDRINMIYYRIHPHNYEDHIRRIEYTNIHLKIYINQLRKFKYTKDKGEKSNYNYFKLKSKMEEKIYNSA